MARTRSIVAAAAAAALLVGACGGDDPEVVDPAPSPTEGAPTQAEPTEDEPTEEPTEDEPTEEPTEDEPTEDPSADGDVPPLDDIWADVIDKAANAESVSAHITGEFAGMSLDATISGQMDDSNFELDGTIDGGEVTLIVAEGESYMRADAAFWETAGIPTDQADAFADQWIIVPPEAGMAEQLSMSTLFGGMYDQLVPPGNESLPTESAELTEFEGAPAYRYVADSEEEVEVWIDAEQETLLQILVLSAPGVEGTIEMTFRDWDSVEPIPAPDDAVTIEELAGGGN